MGTRGMSRRRTCAQQVLRRPTRSRMLRQTETSRRATPSPTLGGPDGDAADTDDETPAQLVADAGPDRVVRFGEVVALDGSASAHQDGLPLDFAWRAEAPAPDCVPLLRGAESATASFVAPARACEVVVILEVRAGGLVADDRAVVSVVGEAFADSDGDLLADADEERLGTDPSDPDTDRDGIPDGWEVHGHGGLDLPGLGCDPRRRDLLVEVDYHDFVAADGRRVSMRPGAALIEALVDFYAGLPVRNHDGSTGIHAVFVVDTPLPESHRCYIGGTIEGDRSPWDPRHEDTFRKLTLCAGAFRGNAPLSGRTAKLRSPPPNADPRDDLREAAQSEMFRGILHELGHATGLLHGGDENTNHKPNYASLMNYSHDRGTDGGREDLGSHSLRFSRGRAPALDECALLERQPFRGGPVGAFAFLRHYQPRGFQVSADGNVDWSRDGRISEDPVEVILRLDAAEGARCRTLRDHDDIARLETRMARGLRSNPR
jgi:hypothetical protein